MTPGDIEDLLLQYEADVAVWTRTPAKYNYAEVVDSRKKVTALLEAKAATEATGIYESAWVIEGMWSSAAYPEYWVGSSAWSSDPYKALRFASKQSAQQAADMMLVGINHRVACHEFAGNSHHE